MINVPKTRHASPMTKNDANSSGKNVTTSVGNSPRHKCPSRDPCPKFWHYGKLSKILGMGRNFHNMPKNELHYLVTISAEPFMQIRPDLTRRNFACVRLSVTVSASFSKLLVLKSVVMPYLP